MSWSTRELAALSGTTVRAIRHYHQVGLLEQPARRANGYKQYDGEHLAVVLRIRRLAALGFSLEEIDTILGAPDDAHALLDDLDARLEAAVQELSETRGEIARIRALRTPVDLSAEARRAMDAIGDDRSLAVVLAHVLSTAEMTDFISALSRVTPRFEQLNAEFAALPPDTGTSDISRLVDAMAQCLAGAAAGAPETPHSVTPGGFANEHRTDVLEKLVLARLNPAQCAVLTGLIARIHGSQLGDQDRGASPTGGFGG